MPLVCGTLTWLRPSVCYRNRHECYSSPKFWTA